MQKIHIIGIDGFHNSGKTTQLNLLKDRLELDGYFVVIRKGDGSRKGDGRSDGDPESQWWQENRERILSAGFEGRSSHEAGIEASSRLNRELFLTKNWWMPREMNRLDKSNGILLVDRGLVSRLFVHRRYEPDPDIASVAQFSTRNKSRDIVIPDITFLLHAPKYILSQRNSHRADGESKKSFNETVFARYYDDYLAHITTLPRDIIPVIPIDSSKPIIEVHNELLLYTTNLIRGVPIGHLEMPHSLYGKERS